MRKMIKKMTEKIKSAVTGTAKKIDFFGEGTRNGSVNGTTNTGINDIPVNGSSESKPKVNGDGKEKVPFEIDGAKSDTSKKEKLDGSSPEKIEPPSTGNNKPEVNASEPNSKTKTKTDVNGSASKIPDPLVECKKNGTSIDNGSKAENESETEINGAATKIPENNAKVPRKKSIEKAAGTKAKSTKKAHSKGSASKKSDKMIGKEIEEAVMRFKQKEQEEIEKIAGEIDKYFTGSSDLMNSIFKKLYADIIKSDIFDDPIIGLRLAERTRSICFNNKDKTALSVAETLNEYNNLELNDKQMIFMLTWAVSFLRSIQLKDGTTFIDLSDIFESHAFLLNKKMPKRESIKSSLTDVVMAQIKRLPKTFDEVKPEKRLDSLAKLLPYTQEATTSSSSELADYTKLLKELHDARSNHS